MSTTYFLALGSNLGDRHRQLDQACRALALLPQTRVIRASRIYETAPQGGPADQRPYLNAVVELVSDLDPFHLLSQTQRIEREHGREPIEQRQHWGPRVLDIDILLLNGQVIDEPSLQVPHPRLHERSFVLEPLAELIPDTRHPTMGRTIRELQASLGEPDRQPSM